MSNDLKQKNEQSNQKNFQPDFPTLAQKPIIRSFHGDNFSDNYEWIRFAPESELLAHVRAENEYYNSETERLADLRTRLVEEYAKHTKEDDMSVPAIRGNYWYWSETRTGEAYPRVWRLPLHDFPVRPELCDSVILSQAELVYDVNLLAEGEEFCAIGSVAFSNDGALCALAIDNSGGETFRIRIHEVATGRIIDDSVVNATYGLVFNADATRIYYLRADEAWRTCELWVHQIGVATSNDVMLWREHDERFEIWIEPSRDGKWLILNSSSRTTSEVYLLDLQVTAENFSRSAQENRNFQDLSLQDLHHPAPFTLSTRREGLEYYAEPAGEGLLVTHNLHNPDFEIAFVSAIEPFEVEMLPIIFSPAPGERVNEIIGFSQFAGVLMRANGAPQIRIIYCDADRQWQMGEILPTKSGQTLEFGINNVWDTDILQFTRESLITPFTVSEYDVCSHELRDLKITEVPYFDPDAYTEYVEWATAEDGTQIPITVAHKKDLKRDGKNPGYVYGYGSYEVTNDVWFNNFLIPLLDRGIVVAYTHLRGGGEFGRAWYEHGKLLEKRNTFTDFVDSTRHLVEIGLVDVNRIAAEGRSAGGLLMGAVANFAPELYRVILAGVPFVDALTTILKPELPLTVGEWEEWGNPLESPEVYAYMKSYTPYENISPVVYPAILAVTSLNDVRVSVIEPIKWVAALRELTRNYDETPLRPILLKSEMKAGHSGGSGRYQRWQNRAGEYAFLLDQLGIN